MKGPYSRHWCVNRSSLLPFGCQSYSPVRSPRDFRLRERQTWRTSPEVRPGCLDCCRSTFSTSAAAAATPSPRRSASARRECLPRPIRSGSCRVAGPGRQGCRWGRCGSRPPSALKEEMCRRVKSFTLNIVPLTWFQAVWVLQDRITSTLLSFQWTNRVRKFFHHLCPFEWVSHH